MKDKPLTQLQKSILHELKKRSWTCTDLAMRLETSRLAIASAMRRLVHLGYAKEGFVKGYPSPHIEYANTDKNTKH